MSYSSFSHHSLLLSRWLLLFPEICITKIASSGTLLVPYPDPRESFLPILCAPLQLLHALLLKLAFVSYLQGPAFGLLNLSCTDAESSHCLGCTHSQWPTGRGRKAQLPCSEAGQMLKYNLLSRAPMGIVLWLGPHIRLYLWVTSSPSMSCFLHFFIGLLKQHVLHQSFIQNIPSSIQLLGSQI